MKPEDIQKELDKFHSKTSLEPGCRLHGGFVPFQFEIFAPPVGTYRMGPEVPDQHICLDGDKVVVTTATSRLQAYPSGDLKKEGVIEVCTFPCEKVEYITVKYSNKESK